MKRHTKSYSMVGCEVRETVVYEKAPHACTQRENRQEGKEVKKKIFRFTMATSTKKRQQKEISGSQTDVCCARLGPAMQAKQLPMPGIQPPMLGALPTFPLAAAPMSPTGPSMPTDGDLNEEFSDDFTDDEENTSDCVGPQPLPWSRLPANGSSRDQPSAPPEELYAVPWKKRSQRLPEVCVEFSTKGGCPWNPCGHLHVCADFVEGRCVLCRCGRPHTLRTTHNGAILSQLGWRQDEDDEVLRWLSVRGRCVAVWAAGLPPICFDYVYDRCLKSSCDELHVCIGFLTNTCQDDHCPRSHELADAGRNTRVIMKAGCGDVPVAKLRSKMAARLREPVGASITSVRKKLGSLSFT
ncbi:uncharacterized protein LOC119103569 [Pollicipes pollicipes]|uniref:uncharacterized protein LOC119103569 n=1 Tax=Pollicipes pollicipes TaxID=41117 RepID=UPI001884F2F6|nr:uncharacterized protein LOC119103569 [Pollicipes pollicipes]